MIIIFYTLFWSNLGITQDVSKLTPQPIATLPHTTDLNVGVITQRPFTAYENGQWTGIAYEIWNLVALQNKFNCTYFDLNKDMQKAIEKVRAHELDVVIGPIYVVSQRAYLVDYSTPYYQGEYVLLAKKRKLSFWHEFDALFHGFSIMAIVILIFIFITYICLFMLIERKYLTDLKGLSYAKGVAHIFWNFVLKQFKVPYVPKTLTMRLLSIIWVFLWAIFMTTVFAGFMASFISSFAFLKEPFQKVLDVGKKPIAAFRGEVVKELAESAGLNVVYMPKKLDDAIDALDSGRVDGIFLLLSFAESYLNTHTREDLYISPIKFNHVPLGFIVDDTNRELLRKINWSILKMSEDGNKLSICNRYNMFINVRNCQ